MNVLIVDDEASSLALLSAMMSTTATSINTCRNGREALDYLAETAVFPDLILLDINMPVLDGILTAKQIHKDYGDYWLPIIFLTDDDSSQMLKTCLTYGDDVITKPVDRRILDTRAAVHADKAQRFNQVLKQYEELQLIHKQQEYEQSVTRNIFSKLMKDCDKNVKGIRFYTSPSSVFNGDILQVLPRPNGGQYILLGDVTGHGLPAAICTIPISRTFNAMCKKWKGVGSIAREINRVLMAYLPDGMMCAMTLIEMTPGGKEFHIWSGGLPDILVLNAQGMVINRLCSQHMPLGVLEDNEFEVDVLTLTLNKTERLVLYTDGITESKNAKGDFYGEQRLEKVLNKNGDDPYTAILEGIRHFSANSAQEDDISLIEIEISALCPAQEETDISLTRFIPVPWEMQLSIDANLMKTFQPVPWLISMLRGPLGEIPALDLISTIFSELYNNALEHGILGLCSRLKANEAGFFEYYALREQRLKNLLSGIIDIQLEFTTLPDAQLIATMSDSGQGFDLQQGSIAHDDSDTYGRGQLLLTSLCSNVKYSNEGRTVTVIFDLTEH